MTASTTNPASHQPTAVLAALRAALLSQASPAAILATMPAGAGFINLTRRLATVPRGTPPTAK